MWIRVFDKFFNIINRKQFFYINWVIFKMVPVVIYKLKICLGIFLYKLAEGNSIRSLNFDPFSGWWKFLFLCRHGVSRLISLGKRVASLTLARPMVFSTRRSMP